MNLVYKLMQKFFKEEWVAAIGIICTSILLTLLYANGLTAAISKLILTVQEGKQIASYASLKWFALLSAFYLFFYYLYKIFQHKFLTKLRQWIRKELLKRVLIQNNTNLSNLNFTKLVSPINRLSTTLFTATSDWLSYIIPAISFLFIISIYLLYTNLEVGGIFLIGNLIIIGYFFLNRQSIVDTNRIYEESVHSTEYYMQEILNNIEKILYFGQVKNEIKIFEDKTATTIDKAYNFYYNSAFHGTVMYSLVNIIVVGLIGYLISLHFNKKLPMLKFVTLITILTVYRENMETLIHQMSDTLECNGRIGLVLESLKIVECEVDEVDVVEDENKLGEISEIKYENVSHKYTDEGPYVLKDLNVEMRISGGKIIGIRGDAGGGKSTMMKLLIKMYKPSKGRILINGIDINEVSEYEIRRKIVYVDQKGKMLDRSIEENVLYGCSECKVGLERGRVGRVLSGVEKLGEKWSGGERQVSNVLGGLLRVGVGGCQVLVLDEPTNGVDKELKEELKEKIREKAPLSSSIVIISHDADVYDLMDETIMLN